MQQMTHQQLQPKQRPQPKQQLQPRRRDVFFHAVKTFKLIKALLVDRRIPIWRKGMFVASLGALLVVLIFPDLLGEFIASTVLPIIGTVLGVPLDAGLDWMAFALLMVSFLRVFPAEVVAEHYQRIFS